MSQTATRTDRLQAAHDKVEPPSVGPRTSAATSGGGSGCARKGDSKTKTEIRNDKLRAAHDKLQAAVESIVTGEDWERMLRTAAKFHRYSFQNQLLIFLQRPDATVVAGFNRWKSLGRFVKKGEKGIAILAPMKSRLVVGSCDLAVEVAAEPDGEDRPKTEALRGFRVVHVFDISQTEGEELPDLDAVRPKLLDADAPDGIWDALVEQATTTGFEVIREQHRSENGFCDFVSHTIAVSPHIDGLQAAKTLIHELAHALLHCDDLPTSREVAEVEVESAAFVVLDALGLRSDDYSFPYVARWADGDMNIVKTAGERVIACAGRILSGLEVDGESARS